MKKTFIYSAIVLLLAVVACNKIDSTVSEEPIRFAFATEATRSLVESNTDLQAQTIKVYDDKGAASYYIDDAVTYGAGTWNFTSGRAYTWRTGSHKFFAFTDGAGSFDDKKLTIEKTLTTADADQVDLLYSDIVPKAESDAGTTVTIPMNHLFAAVGIMVKNATSGEVTVKSVSKPAIANNGSATVDFSGSEVSVSYGTVTASGDYSSTAISNLTLAASGLADIIAQTAAIANAYWLAWPQEVSAEGLTVAIEYTIGSKTYSQEVKLPAAAATWTAGYKYLYTISINPHDIVLDFTVTDWVTNAETTIIVE